MLGTTKPEKGGKRRLVGRRKKRGKKKGSLLKKPANLARFGVPRGGRSIFLLHQAKTGGGNTNIIGFMPELGVHRGGGEGKKSSHSE